MTNVCVPIVVDVSIAVYVSVDAGVFTHCNTCCYNRIRDRTRGILKTQLHHHPVIPIVVIVVRIAIAEIATGVIATVAIASGSPIRVNFTRLKSQCADGQRKDRKQ